MAAKAFRVKRATVSSSLDGIAAVTFYFNHANCPRLRKNAERFIEHWRGFAVPLYVVEVICGRRKPHLTGANVSVVRVRDPLFHKEAAINYAVANLPAEKDIVAWIDSDLIFDLRSLRRLRPTLENATAVQLFSEIQYLDANGEHENRLKRSFVDDNRNGYHGGAWACRRDTFGAIGGLPNFSVTGGGDSIFLMAVFGDQLVSRWDWYIDKHSATVAQSIRSYAAANHRFLNGRVECMNAKAVHLWHGATETREYQSRHKMMESVSVEQLRFDENGFPYFQGAPKARKALAEYWKRRKC